ncbi:MAG: NAD-dependent epimerase/dehydratase family protein [Proteobacteria bacterium]|nr:NAD-dependent epimerase/dehydratase family protein [Desulfobulbaceae bacterium]MBU4154289.1 NAD-dependent epimerase/dehydratase family protein [Pseudomonadota bacterium]
MKKALVTGGGGFVGLAIVKRLLSEQVQVIVVGRQRYPEVERLGVECRRGDIRDGQFVDLAARGCDAVFHVAAKAGIWGSRQEYFSINLTGTQQVIRACLSNDIGMLVYTSTPSVVFARHDLAGVDESVPYARNFLCHYAHSKALAEDLVLKANGSSLRTVALRPHLVWGPGDTNLIPRLVDRGRRGLLKQVGDGKNLVDIAYIDNVVDAHLLAAANLVDSATAAGKAYFISQGGPVYLWGWINGLFAELGIPPVTRQVSFAKAYAAGVVMEAAYRLLRLPGEPLMTRFLALQLAKSHWFSTAAARRDLGYEARVSTPEGMKRLVASLSE